MKRSEDIDRLEALFHRARELDSQQRARFIAELRASDPKLGDEVASLLAAHKESGNFIDSPAYEAAASLIAGAQSADLTGSSINHYSIIKLLGKGGMGEVYCARDTKLNRDVALKLLPEAFATDKERLARFRREAQVLASLNHPNIAAIYDLVECEDKQVLVLEMVEGETLADRLKHGAIPLAEALKISLQIAEALRAAHKKGIIHRDLKPANIKITPEERVKVLDFGLAKHFRNEGNEIDSQATTPVESMTVTGVIVGTPAYMSPEQAVGEAADARSDIFSFGGVLYEMLTGRRPFSGDTVTALLQSVLTNNPLSPRRLRREIPIELDRAVMKALRKQREQRQQSMEELCAELGRLSARARAQPSGLAPSLTERLRAWGVENKRKAVTTGALLILVILGVVGLQVYRGGSVPTESLPAAPIRVNADAGTYELFQQGLSYLERYDKEENIEAAFQAFNTALSKDENYAPAYAGLGMAYMARFQGNRDKSLLDLAVQNARHAVELDGHVAINRVSLGRAYFERGDYELAEVELKQATVFDPLNADAHRGLADIQRAKGNGAEAEKFYKKAIELRSDDWDLHYALGVFYYRQSRFADAEKVLNEVIRLAPDCHMAHRNLGAVYHMQGHFAKASAEFQTALQIRPSASVYSNLGTSLFFQGLYQQSVTAFQEALKLGANNYQIWANLGDAYRQTPGNEVNAREAFMAAIQLVRDELSGNPKDGDLRSQLALYLAKSGAKREALEQAAQAKKLDQSAEVLATLVLIYEICGLREQALGALAAALKKGYTLEEFSRDPELLEMRKDPEYRKLVAQLSNKTQD
jgi:serine/threonine-protein kinase